MIKIKKNLCLTVSKRATLVRLCSWPPDGSMTVDIWLLLVLSNLLMLTFLIRPAIFQSNSYWVILATLDMIPNDDGKLCHIYSSIFLMIEKTLRNFPLVWNSCFVYLQADSVFIICPLQANLFNLLSLKWIHYDENRNKKG